MIITKRIRQNRNHYIRHTPITSQGRDAPGCENMSISTPAIREMEKELDGLFRAISRKQGDLKRAKKAMTRARIEAELFCLDLDLENARELYRATYADEMDRIRAARAQGAVQ